MQKELFETTGKVEEEKFQPTLLEQVWGVDNMSRYGTLDENVYTQQVENMTRADLESHAHKMHVSLSESSLILRDKLVNEFRSYVALVRKPLSVKQGQHTLSDAAMKVLAEGR